MKITFINSKYRKINLGGTPFSYKVGIFSLRSKTVQNVADFHFNFTPVIIGKGIYSYPQTKLGKERVKQTFSFDSVINFWSETRAENIFVAGFRKPDLQILERQKSLYFFHFKSALFRSLHLKYVFNNLVTLNSVVFPYAVLKKGNNIPTVSSSVINKRFRLSL
jgi:hypothetical protein